MRQATLTAAVLLGLTGCATVRTFSRAAPEPVRDALNDELNLARAQELGLSRHVGETILAYEVETVPAQRLQLLPDQATWVEGRHGGPRRAPLEAVAWVGWSERRPATAGSVVGVGALGLLGGAAGGALLGLIFMPDPCGRFGVPAFGFHCAEPDPTSVWVGAVIGGAAGAAVGALLRWLLPQRVRVELTGTPELPAQ